MKFEHREIPEGINVTQVHPLRELAVLLGGAVLLVVLLVFLLSASAGYLARYIPFSVELEMASSFAVETGPRPEVMTYLEQQKTRVVKALDLPDDMVIELHYVDDDTVNAFATLGGHVVLFRGLLERLNSEDALVMLLAHEIAHVKHRDPIISLSRGLTVSAVLGLLLGMSDLNVLGDTGLYTLLHFSREMESAADRAALETVHTLYGHTKGAKELFRVLHEYRQAEGESEGLEVFQSHPLDRRRIDAVEAHARERRWITQGEITTLPESFRKALKSSVAASSEVSEMTPAKQQ